MKPRLGEDAPDPPVDASPVQPVAVTVVITVTVIVTVAIVITVAVVITVTGLHINRTAKVDEAYFVAAPSTTGWCL